MKNEPNSNPLVFDVTREYALSKISELGNRYFDDQSKNLDEEVRLSSNKAGNSEHDTNISPNSVHIWHLSTEDLASLNTPTKLSSILSELEINRASALSNPDVKAEYLATRSAIRILLSHYARDVSPKDWVFSVNKYGAPRVQTPRSGLHIQFNISHSASFIVIALSVNVAVGVDTEKRTHILNWLELAKDSLAPQEESVLKKMPPDKIPERFFEYWTLKESYIKARGMGLNIPLEQFYFILNPKAQFLKREISIFFSDEIKDSSPQWQFRLIDHGDFQIALAVYLAKEHELTVTEMGSVSLSPLWLKISTSDHT